MAAIVEPAEFTRSALPVCPAPWRRNPHRLVSLWDIMRLFRADLFMKMSAWNALTEIQSNYPKLVSDDEDPATPNHPREIVGETRRLLYQDAFYHFEKECIDANLTTSAVTVRKLQEALAHQGCMCKELAPLAIELQGRLFDEASIKYFFFLDTSEAEHYKKPTAGWSEVLDRFPEATTDVEEMNKCFAFSRYAAVVFHSVQAIECGLIEFGKFLNVNDPKSGWTAVTGKLATLVVKTKYPDLDPIYQKHFAFLEQMHGSVGALNTAWRNKISHAQNRLVLMTSEFSLEVAEEIMIASRSFMRRLATELPT